VPYLAPAVTLVAKLPGSMYATDAMKAGPKAANAARARRRVGGVAASVRDRTALSEGFTRRTVFLCTTQCRLWS